MKPINNYCRCAICTLLCAMLQSCATFPRKYTQRMPTINKGDLQKLNGRYKIAATAFPEDTTLAFYSINQSYDNAFEKFYRGKEGRGDRDTMLIGNPENYSFEIKIIDDKRIEVISFKGKSVIRKQMLKYKFVRDRYLLVKNRNFRYEGLIPYIFGGFDVRRRRLALDNNHLVIEESHHSSGGLLIIFGDSKVWHHRFKYDRIN